MIDTSLDKDKITGATYNLSIDGDADAILGEGWSTPERKFSWATGPVSFIRLTPTESLLTRYITMEVFPNSPPGAPPQRVTISAGGVELRRYMLARPSILTFALPSGLGHTVRLDLPDGRSAGAPDKRTLAIAVSWLRVSQDVADTPLVDVMSQYIGLGSNCEFGFAQRRLGAEPIDLFRFASSSMEGLCRGLTNGFADLTDPKYFRLALAGIDTQREYLGSNPIYQMSYHTFIYETSEIPYDVMLKRELGRLRFLARKLMEDAASARRMFIYWDPDQQFSALDAMPLRDILFGYNRRNALLIVEEARPDEQTGSVTMVARGLYRGTIKKFAPREDVPSLEHLQWGRMCANGLALR